MMAYRPGGPIVWPPAPRNQSSIMANWSSEAPPVISVICHTYNQEAMVADALNGILMQETRVPFEIVLHDDASTDGTRAIIEDYIARYPRLIVPILQETNMWRQSRRPLEFTAPVIRGRYIAICEGDDAWIDSGKLQRQFDALEASPGIDMCYHRAVLSFVDSRKESRIIANHALQEREVIPCEQIVRGGGGYCPTASLLLRRSVFDSFPDWFWEAPTGDPYLQFLGARRGGAVFMRDVMSVYRRGTESSWTRQMRDPDAYLAHVDRALATYEKAAAWCAPDYAAAFRYRRGVNYFFKAKTALRKHDIRHMVSWSLKGLANSPGAFAAKLFRVLANRVQDGH